MKYILISVVFFALFVFLAAFGAQKQTNKISSQEPIVYDYNITQVDINEAFIDNPKKWGACWDHESSIREKKEGYVSSDYERYPVVNTVDVPHYKFTVKENDVHVKLTCGFIVFYQSNAFLTIKEVVSYPGGEFVLQINHSSEGYIKNLTFK